MNVKIQGGGGGTYANNGSCVAVTNYLEHEELERVQRGQDPEHFFTHNKEHVSAREATYNIDKNKAKLSKKDSKFFVITVSPSSEEIKAMGKDEAQRIKNFKRYINTGVMNQYAENFGKDLQAKDLMYYAKIHHTRGNKEGEQMHAHIIVSRKDLNDKIKLSPMTNHRGTRKGAVKGGFDREIFVLKSEKYFDLLFNYKRDFKHSFGYQNTMKNGSMEDVKQLPEKELQFNQQQEYIQDLHQEARKERSHDNKQEQSHEYEEDRSHEYEEEQSHEYEEEQSHEYEEEQEQTQRRGRGM